MRRANGIDTRPRGGELNLLTWLWTRERNFQVGVLES
jgi:hypothetical protein